MVMNKSARKTRELAQQLGKLTEAQAALGWGVILVLAALLGAIYLNQTSQIAATGRRVQILQDDLDTLKRENAELEQQIAQAQAVERLMAEAQRLGFVPAQPGDIEYVVIPNYPSGTAEPTPSATPTPGVPPFESMRAALWRALENSIYTLIRGASGEQ